MTEQSSHIHFDNTNRWDTRQLVTMALMCAVSAILMYLQIPLIPAAPFLTYDPSLVPAMVTGLLYGPGSGIAVGAVAIAIHALTTGDWVGALMNLVATVFFVLPGAWVGSRTASLPARCAGMVLAVVLATAASVVANLTIGVWFWYGSLDVIVPLLIPAVIPFNLIKTVLNAVLSLAVSVALRPVFESAKGSRK